MSQLGRRMVYQPETGGEKAEFSPRSGDDIREEEEEEYKS